jgi:chemotaxis protein CheD
MGALCHAILPNCPPEVGDAEGYRYVDFAIRNLIHRFEELGADRSEIEVKVFGGADVLPSLVTATARGTVGVQNCQRARDVLAEEGLRIAAFDLGGPNGRFIEFNTGTGEVLVRMLGAAVEASK